MQPISIKPMPWLAPPPSMIAVNLANKMSIDQEDIIDPALEAELEESVSASLAERLAKAEEANQALREELASKRGASN